MFLMITSSHQFCCFRGRQTFLQAVSFSLLVLLALSINSSHALAQADYDTRLEKGVELFSQLKYPEAGVFFQNLIKSEPERKEAHFWLGKTYAKEGRWNEARDVFKQYVKLGPQDVDGQREIARSYEVEGNVELARLWHMKVLEINPTHKDARRSGQTRTANTQGEQTSRGARKESGNQGRGERAQGILAAGGGRFAGSTQCVVGAAHRCRHFSERYTQLFNTGEGDAPAITSSLAGAIGIFRHSWGDL